ncbi:MAG: DUF305 domain-containing protein [Lapillicoccus sp.]
MNTTIRHFLTATASVAVVLALAGCGGSNTSVSSDGSMPGMPGMTSTSMTSGSGSQDAAAHNQADVTFATNMIPHHQQAVEMADLALKQASNAQVKALAGDVKTAQDQEIQTMTGWLTGWEQPVPTPMTGHDMSSMGGMDGMMSAQEMQQLQAATGAAFDRMWLQMMTKHHQGAVAMATSETHQGQNANAKALAQQIITAQNKEIATMTQLLPTITG